ncbi:hypothetical protein [Streptococcus halotolerans]|uniref:hypothetical protein n=1 Tax=Streptococcus halotolerans TaxID=1814128 RepID=UPI000787E76A|nr:hypothetical protein [Streptococcus halotolerans]
MLVSGFVGGISAISASVANSCDIDGRQTFVTSMAIITGNIGLIATPLMSTQVIQDMGLECY